MSIKETKEVRGSIALFVLTGMLLTLFVAYDITNNPVTTEVKAQEPVVVVSPSPKPLESTTVTEKEVVEDTPENYIYEVFGEHADKAFLLLKGNGEKGSCAENRTLDPKAYNRNWNKDKPGEYWSTDWNIFQVNDKFHPVTELNLKDDWKANIRYAKKMFDNDGQTFAKRWTCGKYYNKLGYNI